jgi:hypothetical protein
MSSFLKTFGEGFLYFIGLPFILVGLIIYGIYLLFVFFFYTIKGLILYFKGKKIESILPEDKKAELILNAQMNAPYQGDVSQQHNSVTYNNTFNQINLHPGDKIPQTTDPKEFFDASQPKAISGQGQDPRYLKERKAIENKEDSDDGSK